MADVTPKDTTVATVRTGWNLGVLGVVAALITHFTGIHIDLNDPLVVVALPVIGGFFYRLSRVVADKYKWVNYVLFGSSGKPVYTETEGE